MPESGGAGTAFTALASAFSQLPAGRLLGLVFFVVLLFAALSSSISLLEALTSYVVEKSTYSRTAVSAGLGTAIFLLGVPTAIDGNLIGWYVSVIFNLVLPLAVFLIVIFVGWVAADEMVDEINRGSTLGNAFSTGWIWWVRLVIPLAVGLTLVLGIQKLLLQLGLLEGAVVLG